MEVADVNQLESIGHLPRRSALFLFQQFWLLAAVSIADSGVIATITVTGRLCLVEQYFILNDVPQGRTYLNCRQVAMNWKVQRLYEFLWKLPDRHAFLEDRYTAA
jgi:hypothetical protein